MKKKNKEIEEIKSNQDKLGKNQYIIYKFQITTLGILTIFFLIDKIMAGKIISNDYNGFILFLVMSVIMAFALIIILLLKIIKLNMSRKKR